DPAEFKCRLRQPATWLWSVIGVVLGGIVLGVWIGYRKDPTKLDFDGQLFASVLHLQLIVDFYLLLFAALVRVWPKGGTVAMAAFREGYRQPLFWLISAGVLLLLVVSMVIPYFTFGDDFKMMKQLGFDIIMLATVLFSVLAACMTITEEIEG